MYAWLFLSNIAYVYIFGFALHFGLASGFFTDYEENDLGHPDILIKALWGLLVVSTFTFSILNMYTICLVNKFGCCFVAKMEMEAITKRQNTDAQQLQVINFNLIGSSWTPGGRTIYFKSSEMNAQSWNGLTV